MPCIDNGQVTCWDGNCADTYAQCPEISSEWGSEDYDVGQYDNPWLQDAGIEGDVFLPGDDGDLMSWIYEEMGGQDSLDMDLAQFTEDYSTYFHDYDPTQAQNIMQQLGLLDASMENRLEGFDLTQEGLELKDESQTFKLSEEIDSTSNELYLAVAALEGVRRRGGGIGSGQANRTISTAFSGIESQLEAKKQGIELERNGIQLGMDQLAVDVEDYLYGAEGTQLNLIQDINKLESNYMDSLLEVMGTVGELIGVGGGSDCGGEGQPACSDGGDDVIVGCTSASDCDALSECIDGACLSITDDICIQKPWLQMCGGDGVGGDYTTDNTGGWTLVDENGNPIGFEAETDDSVDTSWQDAPDVVADLMAECADDTMGSGFLDASGQCQSGYEAPDGQWVDYNQPPSDECSYISDGDCYSYDVESGSFVVQGPAALYMQFGELAYDMFNDLQNSDCDTLQNCVQEVCQGAADNVTSGELTQGVLDTGLCAAGVVTNGVWALVGGVADLWGAVGGSGLDLISSWIDGGGPSYDIADYDSYEDYCAAVPGAYLCHDYIDIELPGDDSMGGCDDNGDCADGYIWTCGGFSLGDCTDCCQPDPDAISPFN